MPQSGDLNHFRGRHHLVVALLIVILCAVVLIRLGSGWHLAGDAGADSGVTLRLDPNTASAQELAAIPGVGPGLAERIVAYRNQQVAAGRNPAFATLGDLDPIEGVGEATLEAIGPYLRLERSTP